MSNQDKQHLIVLDHANQEVHIFPYDENVVESPEDFICEASENCEGAENLKLTNCEFMLVNKVQINFH